MKNESLKVEINAMRDELKALTQRLDELEEAHPVASTETKVSTELSPEEFERLPWKPFEPADPGNKSGWIFADDAPQELIKLLKESHRRIPIGNYAYKLSQGYNQLFVNRVPIRKISSRRQQGRSDRAIQTLVTDNNEPKQDGVACMH